MSDSNKLYLDSISIKSNSNVKYYCRDIELSSNLSENYYTKLQIQNLFNSNVPIGTIIMMPCNCFSNYQPDPYPNPYMEGTWLYCNGSKVKANNLDDYTYQTLYWVLAKSGIHSTVVEQTSPWYWGYVKKEPGYLNDGVTPSAFYIPDFRNRVPWGYQSYTTSSGPFLSAGLPEISGNFGISSSSKSCDGSFFQTVIPSETSSFASQKTIQYSYYIVFQASHNDSYNIYGKSSTVQPPSFQVDYYIKAKL